MKMSSFAFSFLACMMSVPKVYSVIAPEISSKQPTFTYSIPITVNHPDEQCKLWKLLGFCENLGSRDDGTICENVECAAPLDETVGTHPRVPIGPADNGTHCRENKVCYDGDCIDLPYGMGMPVEILEDEEGGYECYHLTDEQPSPRYYE